MVSYGDGCSEYHFINAGVPKGSILAATLYNIYTSDIPHNDTTTFGSFANDTDIIAFDPNLETTPFQPQSHLNQLQIWFLK